MQVDAYLMSGNVLIKGLDPEIEKISIEALRQFFFDYGALINFSVRQWRYVILVLFDKNTLPKVPPSPQNVPRNGVTKGQRKAMDITGFRCVKEGKTYLIEIPHKFKVPALLEFIRLNLPLTNPMAGYTTA